MAADPAVQAKAKMLTETGKTVYQAVTSPEAKRAYRQAAEVTGKMRKK
ncbi:hypothetical protein [Arthrobacter sp. 24S4-2]|nr:hypothetical protein [Arthrobacter sp. 24S4-2]